MSKYVVAWPQNHRTIKWLYYAEIRDEQHPSAGAYASPSGTKVIMRSALLAEAHMFDSKKEAEEVLWDYVGYGPTAQIKKLTAEDLERARKELFSQRLGNIIGTDS